MTLRQAHRQRAAQLVIVAALTAVFIVAIYQSWGMWFDPIADTGRDLYIPERIAEGDLKLYRDVSYLYPPVAPYLLAAIVSLFGSSLRMMAWVGIVSSGLIALLLYLIGRRWSGPAGGALLAFLFVSVHMTGISGYSFNFIFPYAHNATFGLLFLLLFLYALMRYASDGDSVVWLAVALAAGTIAGWSKIEYAATFLIILVSSFAIRRPRMVPIVIATGANLVILAILNWFFSDAPPERHWLTMNILPQSLLSGSVASRFYDRVRGLDQPIANLLISARGALLIIGSVSSLAAAQRLGRLRGIARNAGIPLLVLLFLVLQYYLLQHFLFFRGWFLVQLLLIPFAIRDRKRSPLLLPLLFALLLGSRILLRLEPAWYGFLFAIPAEIVILHVLFAELPRRNIYGRALALAWIPLFLTIGLSSLATQRAVFERREGSLVTTSRGDYHDRNPERAAILNEMFRILERRQPQSMVVVPEGLAINWLTRVDSSIPYHTFSPAELPDAASQRTVIRAIEQNPPEVILLIDRNFLEFGYRAIGLDFGHELMRNIECAYEPVVYRKSERFFAALMERTEQSECP